MPGLDRVPPGVRTTYLGQYTRGHAQRIAEALEADGIVWWSKEPGFLSSLWEHGVRLFVDRSKLEDAHAIATRIVGTS